MSDAETQPNAEANPLEPGSAPTETPPADGATQTEENQETAGAEPEDKAADGGEPGSESPGGTEGQGGAKKQKNGGWQRKIDRQDRQIAQQAEIIERLSRQIQPAPTAANGKEPTAAEKTQAALDGLIDQRMAEREAQQRTQTVIADWARRTDEVRTKHSDFDDVVSSVSIPAGSPLGQALLPSEHGPEILYQLASDKKLLARISALQPFDAAREIGKLEAQLASSTATRTATGVKTRPSPAPAPVTPVTARGPSNVKPVEQMSYEEYRAWRDSPRKR